jgi:hypothetical protein
MIKFASKYKGGLTNSGLVDLLSYTLDLQYKNQFECLISNQVSNTFTGGDLASTAGNVALSAGTSLIDNVMAKVFLNSITIPSYGYEYRKIEGTSFVASAIYPESVTLSFLEDTYGITRRWIQYWMTNVAVPYEFDYKVDDSNSVKYHGRIFKENQRAAKKDATVLLTGNDNIPYYPRIMLYGLRPQSVEEVTIGHEEQEKLTLNLVCSIDEIKVPWLV